MNIVHTIFAILLSTSLHAQSPTDFYGEWNVHQIAQNPRQLSLKKTQPDTITFGNWGVFFQFNQDGTYSEYASAPCGLDDNRYRYSGKWTFIKETGVIELTDIKVLNNRPNIYNNYKVLSSGRLQVSSIQDGVLKLQVLQEWEKVSPK